MTDERFERLSDGQRDCLRLILRHHQIKEIAHKLAISPSTVNQRLGRARSILGASSSRMAARLVAEHEHWPELWIPAAGYENPLPEPPLPVSSEPTTVGIGIGDADFSSSDAPLPTAVQDTPRLAAIKWPIPTAGRPDNDLSALARVAWVFPVAMLSLILLMIVALLSLGLQDMLAGLQGTLARLF